MRDGWQTGRHASVRTWHAHGHFCCMGTRNSPDRVRVQRSREHGIVGRAGGVADWQACVAGGAASPPPFLVFFPLSWSYLDDYKDGNSWKVRFHRNKQHGKGWKQGLPYKIIRIWRKKILKRRRVKIFLVPTFPIADFFSENFIRIIRID